MKTNFASGVHCLLASRAPRIALRRIDRLRARRRVDNLALSRGGFLHRRAAGRLANLGLRLSCGSAIV